MWSSNAWPLCIAVLAGVSASSAARAETSAPGFALERLYPSAAGGGWFVMDDLRMQGGLNGALELTTGFARDPLTLSGNGQRLAVVSDEAFADIGAAVSYDRVRFYAD